MTLIRYNTKMIHSLIDINNDMADMSTTYTFHIVFSHSRSHPHHRTHKAISRPYLYAGECELLNSLRWKSFSYKIGT